MQKSDLQAWLKERGIKGITFKNKKSPKFVLLLDNNTRTMKEGERMVVFRMLCHPFHIFTLNRDLFYDLFEECESGEAMECLKNWFEYNNDEQRKIQSGRQGKTD